MIVVMIMHIQVLTDHLFYLIFVVVTLTWDVIIFLDWFELKLNHGQKVLEQSLYLVNKGNLLIFEQVVCPSCEELVEFTWLHPLVVVEFRHFITKSHFTETIG